MWLCAQIRGGKPILTLVVLCCVIAGPSLARTEFCGLPSGVKGFLSEVFSLSTAAENPDPARLHRLRVMFDLVTSEDAIGALEASSGVAVSRALEGVTRHAAAVLSGQPGAETSEILSQIQTVWSASETHCSAKSQPAPVLGTSNGTGVSATSPEDAAEGGPATQPLGIKNSNPPSDARADVDYISSRLWILGALLLLLASGAILIWVLSAIKAKLKTQRKGCRITAGFESDLDVVDGYVIEIGRKRMVFKPVNAGAFKRTCLLLTDLGGEGDFVVFGDLRLEVFAEEIGDGAILFRLAERLSRAEIDSVLTHSLISPFAIENFSVLNAAKPDTIRLPDADTDAAVDRLRASRPSNAA